jgi:hypothetical protein
LPHDEYNPFDVHLDAHATLQGKATYLQNSSLLFEVGRSASDAV